ncbi:MAG: 16S rRNA methyltransferase [Bdellovibrio sp. ArHS]|uniref:16S rRNA (guanine(527)-N(7))-methyltransferase RsmG n=1 Tax=Bdellovibrio sp. ArHS TaxID=1569284 RepID=UPI000583BB1D|nr:16S rRNA (guanine(527)-N(7))-methyltransferase RsmG [Bdellovibrio sp. ArHS]KHD87243.1 MAG: 16S rRNA methyltransferase [Bdellovibrio sp. ArHS]
MNNKDQQDVPTIYWRIDEWFPDLSPETRTRLKAYHEELLKFNRTLTLISPKTVFVADAVHFADSILASRTIQRSNPKIDKITDVGSGNGFPGMVFAILYPQIQVTLLDIDQKKCEFLKHLASHLKLSNVTVENKNVESLPENSLQYAMARGFANISRTILSCRKVMQKGGAFYHLKSEEWGIEVGEIPTQLCSIWTPSLVGEYKLPVGAVKFSVVKTDKIA